MRRIFTKSWIDKTPIQLFRVCDGRWTNLRAWDGQRRSFDIVLEDGKAQPRALSPTTYYRKDDNILVQVIELTTFIDPNGASLRPLSDYQRKVIEGFRAKDVVVYGIPEGESIKIGRGILCLNLVRYRPTQRSYPCA